MERGFTLIELLVTAAVLVIILSIGTPALQALVRDARMHALVSGYLHTFNTARASALSASRNISICPTDANATCVSAWSGNMATFFDDDRDGQPARADDIIDHIHIAGAEGIKVTLRAFGRTHYVALRANGRYRQNGTFRFCAPGESAGRAIVINAAGRARTQAITCAH